MDVLYVSNLVSRREYEALYANTSVKLNQQAQKFNRLLAEGLAENGCAVTVLSGRPLNAELHPKKFYKKASEKEGYLDYMYASSFNYSGLRQITLYCSASRLARQWLKKHPDGIMICDVLNISLTAAVQKVFKRRSCQTIGVVTDLPEMLSSNNKSVKMNNKLIETCNKIIILAEAMNDKINQDRAKPYIVVEGFADKQMGNCRNLLKDKYFQKVVLYTGLLHEKYGVANLVNGFLDADIPETELHLYGTGDFADKLREIAKTHRSIKYFGTVLNADAVEAQIKATLLVNPRPVDEEFVKYSFPSKNLEYMASGTPMLTTMLPSMPEEYNDYVFTIPYSSRELICEKLKEILSIDAETLHDFGAKAKKFVMENKNNVMQSKKIKDWIG